MGAWQAMIDYNIFFAYLQYQPKDCNYNRNWPSDEYEDQQPTYRIAALSSSRCHLDLCCNVKDNEKTTKGSNAEQKINGIACGSLTDKIVESSESIIAWIANHDQKFQNLNFAKASSTTRPKYRYVDYNMAFQSTSINHAGIIHRGT